MLTSMKKKRVAMGRMKGTVIEKKSVKMNSDTAIAFLNPMS